MGPSVTGTSLGSNGVGFGGLRPYWQAHVWALLGLQVFNGLAVFYDQSHESERKLCLCLNGRPSAFDAHFQPDSACTRSLQIWNGFMELLDWSHGGFDVVMDSTSFLPPTGRFSWVSS